MKIREYSDMHLDWYNLTNMWYPPKLPDDKETILILAGDIWVGTKFIRFGEYSHFSWIGKVAPRFKQVLIVLGNHDYWPTKHGLSIVGGGKRCNDELTDHGLFNVKVLDRDTHSEGDYLFVGATLWTDMDRYNQLTMHNMRSYMAKDGKITFTTFANGGWHRFTSEKWVDTHTNHRKYFEIIAEQNRDKKIIVISHHVPLTLLTHPNYVGSSANGYYSSDLSDVILDNENIIMWFYGHTHHQDDRMFEQCRMINNAVGYQGEHMEQEGLVKHEVITLGE